MSRPLNGASTTCRLRKVECINDGYIARVSRTTIITLGAPICPVCRTAMTEERA